MLQSRGQQSFFIRDQITNIFRFGGHQILCCSSYNYDENHFDAVDLRDHTLRTTGYEGEEDITSCR